MKDIELFNKEGTQTLSKQTMNSLNAWFDRFETLGNDLLLHCLTQEYRTIFIRNILPMLKVFSWKLS